MTESVEARQADLPGGATALLERDAELRAIAERLATADRGRGGAVLVEGPPGIGKTALLATAAARAQAAGALVLRATGRELERDFAFGVARQLFEPVLAAAPPRQREALLAGAGGPARRLLGPADDAPAAGDAAFAIAHALYWVTAGLAARRPLLMTVDDAHRADAPSLVALAYLAPRLDDLRVLLLLVRRTVDGEPPPELEALLDAVEPRRIAPAPLSRAATARLVRAVASPAATDAFCDACHEASGGVPLYVRELAACAIGEELPLDAAGVARFGDLTPEGIARTTAARIAALGGDARRLAQAVAVLEHGPLHTAAGLAGLDDAAAADAASALARAGILLDGLPLQFAHPILRSAVYAALPPPARAVAHRRAARLLHDVGSDGAAATHLLQTEPGGEPWAVATLRRAAGEALARGAPRPALDLLRRALDERPAGADPALLLELGRAELACGEPAAREHLDAALAGAGDPLVRARVLGALSIASYLAGDLEGALGAAGRALDDIGDRDAPALEARLLYPFAMAGRSHPRLVGIVRDRLARLRPDDGRVGASARAACLAFDRFLRGDPVAETRALARRAAADERLLALGWDGALALQVAAFTLVGIDELDAADAALAAVFDLARRDGSPMELAVAAQDRLWSRWRRGLVPQALADADVVLDIAARGWFVQSVPARVAQSDCLMERGDLAAAGDALALDPAVEAQVAGTWGDPWLHYARSRIRLEQGDAAGALEEALDCGRRQQAIDADNPAFSAWRSRAALAALRLGDSAQARELCAEELRLAQAFGTPRPIGVALRTASVVAGGDEGIALLREAAGVLSGSPALLEQARALVELGAARAARATRGSRCATGSRSPASAAPRRWPIGPATSCGRPAGGSCARRAGASTRCRPVSCASPSSPPTGSATPTSPRRCSSRARPSSRICARSSASWASRPGPSSRRCCARAATATPTPPAASGSRSSTGAAARRPRSRRARRRPRPGGP